MSDNKKCAVSYTHLDVYKRQAQNVPESVQTTKKQLVAFGRAEDLEPGESTTVEMQISKRMMSYWYSDQEELTQREDGTKDKWILATGERDLMLAKSSDNVVETVTVEVTE